MTTPASDWAPNGQSGLLTPLVRLRDWLDERGKFGWIAALVVSFIVAWPIGLAVLFYLIWSKRMFGSKCGASKFSMGQSSRHVMQPSGNSAFDAYRADMLKRLEDEHEQFQSFLQHLREAKDKEEFDAFMQSRREPAAPSGN